MAAVGRIKGSSTLLKMERSRIFEEVWTIEFDGCLGELLSLSEKYDN